MLDNYLNDIYDILIVETNANIVTKIKDILKFTRYNIHTSKSLSTSISILESKKIDILLIDSSTIKNDKEYEDLKNIRINNEELYIIVLIDNEKTINIKTLQDIAVQGYFPKNDKFNQLQLFTKTAINYIDQIRTIKKINDELLDSKKKIEDAYLESIEILRQTVEAKDTYTRGHSDRVAAYSVLIGQRLGLSPDEIRTLRIGGMFHDIGKIGIPDKILLKADKLDSEEYNEIKKHPIIGKNILSNAIIFKNIIPIVLYHHERYDGKGYPYGLSDKEIPFLARIVSVADAFDAMTTKRSYRPELKIEYVKKEIKSKIGTQFDPIVATTFLDVINTEFNIISEIQKNY